VIGMPTISLETKAAALENIKRQKGKVTLGGNERSINHPDGHMLTLDQQADEINRETDFGLRLARIWAQSEAEINAFIGHAKSSVLKAGTR